MPIPTDTKETSSSDSIRLRPLHLATALALLAVSIALIYLKTLNYPFLFDDLEYIVGNEEIRDLANFWPPEGTRFLGFLSFALNYHLNGLDVTGYHAVNILLHLGNSILVFLITFTLFRTPLLKDSKVCKIEGLPFGVALISAMIFATHPVQTQGVTYITQRIASLSTFFYLLALLNYAGGRIKDLTSSGGAKVRYAVAFTATTLAMISKEISFTAPFVILLFDAAFFPPEPHRVKLRRVAPFLATLVIIPLALLAPELGIGGGDNIKDDIRRLQVEELMNLSPYEYLLTQFSVIATYLRLIVLPIWQSVDYHFPLHTSLLSLHVIAPLILEATLFIGAVAIFMKARRGKDGLKIIVSGGIIWFFIALSIESSIIPIQDVIFEHRLYLPLGGGAMALGGILAYATEEIRRRFAPSTSPALGAIYMAIIISIPLGGTAYLRNNAWASDLTLWKDVTVKQPLKARGHYNYGRALKNRGDLDGALREYKETVRLKADYANGYMNMGNIYFNRGRPYWALKEYLTALEYEPENPSVLYNLGNLYLHIGNLNEAERHLKGAIVHKPSHKLARCRLGKVYINQGRLEDSIKEFEEVLKENPNYTIALRGAIEAYRLVVKNSPNYGAAYYRLGELLLKVGEGVEAKRSFEDFLRVAPPKDGKRAYAMKVLESLAQRGIR